MSIMMMTVPAEELEFFIKSKLREPKPEGIFKKIVDDEVKILSPIKLTFNVSKEK